MPRQTLRHPSVGLLAFLAILTITAGLLVGLPLHQYLSNWREIRGKQRDLLYKTDHAKLLAESEAMWRSRPEEDPAQSIAPNDAKLPPLIRSLGAHEITVFKSGVRIEMGGQGRHYGFESFFTEPPEDTRTVYRGAFPSKQLLPGLWYYAENGLVPP